MSKELKRAILWGLIAETISFTLLQFPFWFDNGSNPLLYFTLGILGGWLNLPAIIICLVGFLMFGGFCDFLGLNVRANGFYEAFFPTVFVLQALIWTRIWWNTFTPRRSKNLKLIR